MKKGMVLVLVIVFSLVMSCLASAEFKKTKIAVLDFQLQGEGYETADMGKIVAEWLITALVKEGRFDIIERRLLKKVIEEQEFGTTGFVDERSASQLGKILGAKIIISGTVMRFQNVMEVNARIIDVESTSIIAAESAKSTTAIRLEDLVVEMAEKIIKDFPLEGYIVNREEDKVLIDLGKRAGVKTGMQFTVYKEGDVIKHPKTGEVLDVEMIETGLIEVKEIRDNTAKSVILKEHTPEVISYGQMVKNVIEPSRPIGKYTEGFVDTSSLPLQPALKEINAMIEEARHLKNSGAQTWKNAITQVFIRLKPLLINNYTSPEIYISYAKAYHAADRLVKANKCLEKAFYYDPRNLEAFIFKGDMYYTYYTQGAGRNKKINKKKFGTLAIEAYQTAATLTQDKDIQANIYLKMGNTFADLLNDKEKAKEYWQKVLSTAPDGEASRSAREKLG